MTRETLPNRRRGEIVAFDHGGFYYTATISRFRDGRLAEVFLNAAQPDTQVNNTAHDLAVAASLALQFGCPASTLRHALLRLSNDQAAGPLGALLDLVEGER